MKTIKKNIIIFPLILFVLVTQAQSPYLIPNHSDPLDLTPLNIVLYFVLPVILIIFYFWWRKSKKKK